MKYAPPPGPPPSHSYHVYPPPLISTPSPLLDLELFAGRGWDALDLSQHAKLEKAFARLFTLSRDFFALDDNDKAPWKADSDKQASEKGWSRVIGEKQLLTLRSCKGTPPQLVSAAQEAWDETGVLLSQLSRSIARSLGLPEDVFGGMVDPCLSYPPETDTNSLLRLFRYDRPLLGEPTRVVAQPHRDLGLLSLVIGHSPGLDVWERDPAVEGPGGRWVAIESKGRRDYSGMTATVLVGQTLTFLTRGRYRAGAHRVSVSPMTSNTGLSPDSEAAYRYSNVFALRPHPAPIYTRNFESFITGIFPPNLTMEGVSAGVLFNQISNQAWNINISQEIREEQKKRLLERKMAFLDGTKETT